MSLRVSTKGRQCSPRRSAQCGQVYGQIVRFYCNYADMTQKRSVIWSYLSKFSIKLPTLVKNNHWPPSQAPKGSILCAHQSACKSIKCD